MIFEENKAVEIFGERIGFIVGYFLFTTVLFYVLTLSNRLPESWSYGNIMLVSIVVCGIGFTIKRLLK